MTRKKRKSIILGLVSIIIICFSVFVFSGKKEQKPKELSIVFNKSGNAAEYKIDGFSGFETNCTWTDGKEASVDIPVPEVSENKFLMVSLGARPMVAKRIKKQTVSVFVNNKFITDFVMTGEGVYKFALPQDLQKSDNVAKIKFRISNPISPKDLRTSSDSRKLGMCVKNITLVEEDVNNPEGFEVYKFGDKIDFSSKGNSKLYTVSGWSNPEKEFTWTDGNDAYLNMFVKNEKNKSLRLLVNGRAALNPGEETQNVTVYVNDKELATWNVGARVDYAVVIPEEVVGGGALRIRFHIAKPFSPKSDPRRLGLAVRSIELSSRFGAQTKTKLASWVKNKVLTDSEEAAKSVK